MAANRLRVPTPEDEVHDALRAELRRLGVGTGPWTGPTANDSIGTIADATETCLRNRLHDVDVFEVLTFAASALADAVDQSYGIRQGNGDSSSDAARAQMHTQNAAAAHAILELAGRVPVDKYRRPPTRRDLEAISTLAHQLWRWRRQANIIDMRLRTAERIRLLRDGTFDVELVDRPPFRMLAYERAMVARTTDNNSLRGTDDSRLLQALEDVVTKDGPFPDEFLELDQAMKADRAYGLGHHLKALEFLVLASGSRDSSVAGRRYAPGDLADMIEVNVENYFPGSDPVPVIQAVRRLVWDQELLLGSPLQLLEDRTSAGRLYSRPIIELSDGSHFLPRHAPGLARMVFLQRVLEGTWPEALAASDARMVAALERRRNRGRPVDGFETHLAHVLSTTGLPYVLNVSQSERSRVSGAVGVPVEREIDAVVATADAAVVWVIEAKDLAMPITPRRIRSELDKYFRPGGHVEKLSKKIMDIAADSSEVARRIGAVVTVDPPLVKGLFVTREPSPAWFHDDQIHACVAIDQLPGFLVA